MSKLVQVISVLTAVVVGMAVITPPATAAMMLALPSADGTHQATQLELERRLVAEQLALFGLNEGEIAQRMSLLTEEEVHQLAQSRLAIGTGAQLTTDQEQWLLWGGVLLGATATILSIIAIAQD